MNLLFTVGVAVAIHVYNGEPGTICFSLVCKHVAFYNENPAFCLLAAWVAIVPVPISAFFQVIAFLLDLFLIRSAGTVRCACGITLTGIGTVDGLRVVGRRRIGCA